MTRRCRPTLIPTSRQRSERGSRSPTEATAATNPPNHAAHAAYKTPSPRLAARSYGWDVG
jgi:hypothetical protein